MVTLEALATAANRANLEQVINKLVQARLLSTHRDLNTGRETVEIIHEALLREWGLLKGWTQEYRNREQRVFGTAAALDHRRTERGPGVNDRPGRRGSSSKQCCAGCRTLG